MVCLCPGRTFEAPWRSGGRAFVSPWALRHLAHLRFARDLDDPGAPQVIGVALDLTNFERQSKPQYASFVIRLWAAFCLKN